MAANGGASIRLEPPGASQRLAPGLSTAPDGMTAVQGGLPLLRGSTTLALDVGLFTLTVHILLAAARRVVLMPMVAFSFYPGYEMCLEPATEQVIVV